MARALLIEIVLVYNKGKMRETSILLTQILEHSI
jgi:hypothetical protein